MGEPQAKGRMKGPERVRAPPQPPHNWACGAYVRPCLRIHRCGTDVPSYDPTGHPDTAFCGPTRGCILSLLRSPGERVPRIVAFNSYPAPATARTTTTGCCPAPHVAVQYFGSTEPLRSRTQPYW